MGKKLDHTTTLNAFSPNMQVIGINSSSIHKQWYIISYKEEIMWISQLWAMNEVCGQDEEDAQSRKEATVLLLNPPHHYCCSPPPPPPPFFLLLRQDKLLPNTWRVESWTSSKWEGAVRQHDKCVYSKNCGRRLRRGIVRKCWMPMNSNITH